MCGEQKRLFAWMRDNGGSPPRVRGTDSEWSENAAIVGITPACAGNRASSKDDATSFMDHPRVCGEQIAQGDKDWAEKGSPPRVRGTGFSRMA